MGRNRHRSIPLEIRWRIPDRLPVPGEVAELAYIRFLDDHTRVTVGRLSVPVSSPHSTLVGVTSLAQAEGWQTIVNSEPQHQEPLSFLDACYAGWATFCEVVPELARLMARTLAAQARHEGWDVDDMEVHLVEGGDDSATHQPLDG